jgi:tRNA-binding EMAP/Myf-like protein
MFLVYATQSARLLIMLIIWQNRKVCVLCNLKPASMRGIKSQAMVLAASNSDHTKVSKLISTFSFVFASFVHLSEVIFPSVKSSNLTNGYVI